MAEEDRIRGVRSLMMDALDLLITACEQIEKAEAKNQVAAVDFMIVPRRAILSGYSQLEE